MICFSEETALQKAERLHLLKQRAETVLAQTEQGCEQPGNRLEALEVGKLLEDLRIYQVELELQNEELRAAQLDAEMSRKRYQYLFSQMPMAAMVVDSKGLLDECNNLADALLGSRKRFVTQDTRLWSKLNRRDRVRLHAALRDVTPGEVQVLDQVVLSDSVAKTPVFDLHLIGLSIDYKLDRRILMLLLDRTVDLARQQDQQFYAMLLDASDSLIYATGKDGKVLTANQAVLDLLGCTRQDIDGHTRDNFMPLRDAILHAQADQQVLQSAQPMTLEEQLTLDAPRGRVDFLTRRFPLRDISGNVYGVGAISTDITMLKDQQRQSLLSETVFMSSADAIIITDAQTRMVRVNPAFTIQSGFSSQAVMGQKMSILKSGCQDGAFYALMWQTISAAGTWSGELCNRRADGIHYTVWCTINTVRNDKGQVLHYIAVQTDVTQLHNAKQALAHQASYDSLTDLPNRALFNDRMAQLMALSQRHGKPFALLFVDLDHFKEVNDTLGHQVGDRLLREISQRLQESVRTEDTVARIGGDEFVVLLPDADAQGAQSAALKFLERLRQPVVLEQGTPYRPMASVGLALFPEDGQTPDLLLRSADLAMYAAKMSGRNRFAAYSPEMSAISEKAFAIQKDLAQAIESQQLRVYFQPKCRLSDGAVMGAEALVRWQRPGSGLVLPGEFIGVAEKSGLLVALDRWVMNESLRQLGYWMSVGLWQPAWRLSVNQNVADLERADMLPELQAMLGKHQVQANAIELEITEDALLNHTPQQLLRLEQLRGMGCTVSIDDFGTGYSSLAYLHKLPVSVIKIDQSFVRGMLLNENDAVLVQTIVSMAHNLGHTLVAEGIEQETQRHHLQTLGVELGQGFLFGRAVSADEFAARWLQAVPAHSD
jgi:two-component system CheB/CheR fusion protein